MSPARSGSKAKPVPVQLKFGFQVSEASGNRPSPIKTYSIGFYGGSSNGGPFPKCTAAQINAAQSDSVCPKGSEAWQRLRQQRRGQLERPDRQVDPVRPVAEDLQLGPQPRRAVPQRQPAAVRDPDLAGDRRRSSSPRSAARARRWWSSRCRTTCCTRSAASTTPRRTSRRRSQDHQAGQGQDGRLPPGDAEVPEEPQGPDRGDLRHRGRPEPEGRHAADLPALRPGRPGCGWPARDRPPAHAG